MTSRGELGHVSSLASEIPPDQTFPQGAKVVEEISRLFIDQKVRNLGYELSTRYRDLDPVLLVVLKGAAYFGMDLSKAMSCHHEIEFCRASSYTGTTRTDIRLDMANLSRVVGRRVVLVEDIVDTGNTVRAIVEYLQQDTISMEVVSLLDKPSRRETQLHIPLTAGFTIPDRFVVGYGLDYNQRFRSWTGIYSLVHKTPSDQDLQP